MSTTLVSHAVAQVVSLLRDRFPTGAILTESVKVGRCGSVRIWARPVLGRRLPGGKAVLRLGAR